MSAVVVFILFVICLVIAIPVSISLGIVAVLPGAFDPSFTASAGYVIRSMLGGIDSFPLLAVPMFVLAGILMAHGKISQKLFDVFVYFIGKRTAGIPCAVIITCLFYGAISGSAPATVAAVGSMTIPLLIELGYKKDFATAIVAVAGGLGVIIPPSIPFIMYAMATGESVSDLFLAGIVPGLMIGALLMFYAYYHCKRYGEDKEKIDKKVTELREKGFLNILKDSIWALISPVIVLGCIYAGIASPTEAAVISVFFALFVAIVLPFILPDSLNWHLFVDSAYTGTVNTIHGTSGTASIYTALTFLVISCPCALVLSVPLAFFSGIGAGSKKGILFKGGIAIEGLKNVKAIVMDKTGTITKGNFVVQKANPAGNAMTANDLLAISASCELSSTHPIGNSIVDAAKEKGLSIERPSKVEEIAGHGIRAELSKGVVLCGNRKLMDEQNVDLSSYQKEDFGTEVLVALNGKFVGNIVISDTVKEDAKEAIAAVKKQGIITAMLTGDAQESADAVAKETGIDEVHAKLLPQDKLSELKKIRESHGAVMFVGDGINDAPVLAGADVGAAMGSGADAAIEAADVVFMNSEMKAIPEAVSIAKMTNSISWQNVVFALAIKIIVMIMGLFGFANMWIAVFADTGVSVLCLLNSIRILHRK